MNVLIVLGHPRQDSFCDALAEAYRDGALEAGADIRRLVLGELEFALDVHTECPSEQELEDDLLEAREDIRWADHLVFVYPNWWGTMPARLKGFFDRAFAPGFAFSFYEDGEGAGHEELLDDKTAELIVTMDVPPLVYRLIQRQPGNYAVKRCTLEYAGIRTTRITNLGSIEESDREQRENWLQEATRLGRSLADGPEPKPTWAKRKLMAWINALRLQFYPMAWVAYTVGALVAAGSGVFSTTAYWLGFLFLFFLEASAVLTNEYVDVETDRKNTFAGPFTGGSRVLVDGNLGFDEVRAGIATTLLLTGAFGFGALSVGVGSVLATLAAMTLLVVLAIGYTVPPLKLSYRTLGELDVAVTHSVGVMVFGFVLLGGAWYDPLPWLLGLPLLLATVPSITLAAVPDLRADRAAGKRTLPVRLGIDRATTIASACALTAALTAVLLHRLDLVAGAYGPIIYLSVFHALGLVWLLKIRLDPERMPRRIDGHIAAALGYVLWFGVVPLVMLL